MQATIVFWWYFWFSYCMKSWINKRWFLMRSWIQFFRSCWRANITFFVLHMLFNLLFLCCLLNFIWKLTMIMWSAHEIMIKIQFLHLVMKFLEHLKKFVMIYHFHNSSFHNYISLFSDNPSFSDDVCNSTQIEFWILLLTVASDVW